MDASATSTSRRAESSSSRAVARSGSLRHVHRRREKGQIHFRRAPEKELSRNCLGEYHLGTAGGEARLLELGHGVIHCNRFLGQFGIEDARASRSCGRSFSMPSASLDI